jgi:sigma-E factor negative regulatory protein RseB
MMLMWKPDHLLCRLLCRLLFQILAASALTLGATAALAANENLAALLKKMAQADDALNYQGIFIMRKADNLQALRVEHGADERGVWESMQSLNGESRKIVRHNDEVMSFYPARKLLTISHNMSKKSLHPRLPDNIDNIDKMASYYSIARLDDDRIADRDTYVLQLTPTDKFRYGYRYWLDDETGVLLKCDLLNESGVVVEQMMFTQLEYLPKVPAAAFSSADTSGYTMKQLDTQRTAIEHSGWQVEQLPAGFMLTQATARKSKDAESMHLVYSDGLASVSVFIEAGANGDHHLDGAQSMGALNAFGTRVGANSITVMGEVPATTVMQIAQSAKPMPADKPHD